MTLSRATCVRSLVAAAVLLPSRMALAVTTDWNDASGGNFADAANWSSGVPDADDVARFRLGAVPEYTVDFGVTGFPTIDVTPTIDRLLVGNNSVEFNQTANVAALTVDNASLTETGRGLIVGEAAGNVSVLSSNLTTLSAVAATLGSTATSSGTLNVTSGTFNVTGSDASNHELIVGRSGTGVLNVTGGADVNVSGANGNSVIGEYAGASGTATVSGAGSTWASTQELWVGYQGAAELNVLAGGAVNNGDAYIATFASSTSVASVDASTWTSSGSLYVGNLGHGAPDITGGGVVADANGYIGTFAGAIGEVNVGEVNVGGAGSTWNNTSALYIGNLGQGTLNVMTGGVVISATASISHQAGSTGEATVNGATSKWINSGDLFVGNASTGTLDINFGGAVAIGTAQIGHQENSIGEVNVTGTFSRCNVSNALYVGNLGQGTLNVTAGGVVTSVTGSIGHQVGSTGAATVDGTGATWTNSGDIYVGNSGAGSLDITGGGHVETTRAYIGWQNNSTGNVSIDGSGAQLGSTESFVVGADGTGSLSVFNGARLYNSNPSNVPNAYFVVGGEPSGIGMVTIDDAQWWSIGTIVIGFWGEGIVEIIDSRVEKSPQEPGEPFNGILGLYEGSHGSLIVDGPNSSWETDTLVVGEMGSGMLTLKNGGAIGGGSPRSARLAKYVATAHSPMLRTAASSPPGCRLGCSASTATILRRWLANLLSNLHLLPVTTNCLSGTLPHWKGHSP